ncbi:E3 ubiquitin-protein ligase SIAH1A, partial [Cryptotermes secundus]|uniref:E3 ubiquitin-protein ligase SIAH1A n=1 Tax=Cryptotermes secundus TaxID=105785 RepID=UPI000CD7CFD8
VGSHTSSSSTTATNTTADSAHIASLFECPVCLDYILPPISQCKNGHLICSNCRPKMTRCPTCRARLGNIRCLGMEKVASTVMFPCKHSTYGCAVALLHTEKREHEETCEFRPYSCPFPGSSCTWQGSREQVVPHLMKCHKTITATEVEKTVLTPKDIGLVGVMCCVMIDKGFDHQFIFVFEKHEKSGHGQCFATVQLIGTKEQAENFKYRLELKSQGKRLTWEATPRSIREPFSSIMKSDCFVLDTITTQLFCDNDKMCFHMTISMV